MWLLQELQDCSLAQILGPASSDVGAGAAVLHFFPGRSSPSLVFCPARQGLTQSQYESFMR
ncbi:hypothetical protein GCM10025790_28020 [Nesterenkonia rhizosphaerae]|uniref:Uncharacterized protein n=1 Tax=Nesterenkonia rhizosphaerae TaxID=1348272 RepID=A0ABP9G474_9MICC